METAAFIGLGSNLGDRETMIRAAVQKLGELAGTKVAALSSIVETKPVGPVKDQPDFLNAVAKIETSLKPLELLDRLLDIERSLGRTRGQRWGPRLIDLDLLLYGSETITHPRLSVPHPEIQRRPFIQAALAELGSPWGTL